MNFSSDNWAGASPKIMLALSRANDGFAPAYGADDWTERASAAFAHTFEHEVAMVATPTGTATNALAIEMGCGRDGLLVCHDEAHAVSAEADSRPILNPGVRIEKLKGVGGKLAPADLKRHLAGIERGKGLGLLSLTNVTEAGLVYRPDEIAALSAIARQAGLRVHIDGARFANAVAATGASPAELSWRSGVDFISFGATKSGALAAEALIAFDPKLKATMTAARKAFGYTFSKGRYFGCQIEAFLADGHWLELARNANALAGRLASGMTSRGVDLCWPCEANEVLAIFAPGQAEALRTRGVRCHDWPLLGNLRPERPLAAGEGVVRFVASFATSAADVAGALAAIEATAARAPAHSR